MWLPLGHFFLAQLIVADGINCLLHLYVRYGKSFIAHTTSFWSLFSEVRLGETEKKRMREISAPYVEKPHRRPTGGLRYSCSNFVVITGFNLIFYWGIFSTPFFPMPNFSHGAVDAAGSVLGIIKHQMCPWTALTSQSLKIAACIDVWMILSLSQRTVRRSVQVPTFSPKHGCIWWHMHLQLSAHHNYPIAKSMLYGCGLCFWNICCYSLGVYKCKSQNG